MRSVRQPVSVDIRSTLPLVLSGVVMGVPMVMCFSGEMQNNLAKVLENAK